jgi:hypothetical protein
VCVCVCLCVCVQVEKAAKSGATEGAASTSPVAPVARVLRDRPALQVANSWLKSLYGNSCSGMAEEFLSALFYRCLDAIAPPPDWESASGELQAQSTHLPTYAHRCIRVVCNLFIALRFCFSRSSCLHRSPGVP